MKSRGEKQTQAVPLHFSGRVGGRRRDVFTTRAQQLTAHPIYVNMSTIKGVAEISTCVIHALTTRGRAPFYCGDLISSVGAIVAGSC